MPALAFGAGAIAFFAVPYTILIYPILFLVFPRLWHVCHKHNYITPADFVRGRFGNRWLALAITITGIVATLPYIALQLVGLQVVIGATGRFRHRLYRRLPLIIAFIILAAFTYSSGLRAPASIAVVKDIADLHHRVRRRHRRSDPDSAASARSLPRTGAKSAARGTCRPFHRRRTAYTRRWRSDRRWRSFLYPHSMTGILSASSGHAIRRNAAMLPAYSFMLGLLALLGFFAIAAGVGGLPEFAAGFKQFGNNFAVPALILHIFPSWFVGIAFAAIGIGALVPAAIMSIAAANLYTRNIHREFINPNPTDKKKRRSPNGYR